MHVAKQQTAESPTNGAGSFLFLLLTFNYQIAAEKLNSLYFSLPGNTHRLGSSLVLSRLWEHGGKEETIPINPITDCQGAWGGGGGFGGGI